MKDKVTPIVLGLVAFALLAALWAPRTHFESPREFEEVPNFTFELNGQEQELSDLRGQVVLLNFWATWCPPCVAEMPSLERLHQRMRNQGLVILGISVDADRTAYNDFLQTYNI
ncbi:MAG: TlpA disulfide reductase family protein, partial [Terriglobia bacterium]